MELLKEIVVIILFAAVAVMFLKMILNSIRGVGARANLAIKSVTAQVAEKRAETGLGEFNTDGLRLGKHLFEIDFLLDNGETVTLEMTNVEFDALEEGSRGCLSYRGNNYLCFTPDSLI